MLKTILAVLVAIVVVLATVVLCVVALFRLFFRGTILWDWHIGESDDPVPFYLRTRKAHKDAVIVLGASLGGDENIVVSVGRDNYAIQFYDTKYGTTDTRQPGFAAHRAAIGYHDKHGTRVAVGR